MSEKAKKKAAEEPTAEEKKNAAVAHATRNKRVLKALVSRLAGEGKMDRARAAEMVHEVACQTPERLIDHIPHLLDALDRPEPQTRWEVLGALEEMAPKFARMLDKAIVPATVSLHDADSGVVRVSAFRMLAAYGATSIRRSEKVWPLLDEALRCYHGDSEYPGMLTGLATMLEGKAPGKVRNEAADLVEPDAWHPKAAIARSARRVFSLGIDDGRTPRRRRPGGMVEVGEKGHVTKKAEPAKTASAAKIAPKRA